MNTRIEKCRQAIEAGRILAEKHNDDEGRERVLQAEKLLERHAEKLGLNRDLFDNIRGTALNWAVSSPYFGRENIGTLASNVSK